VSERLNYIGACEGTGTDKAPRGECGMIAVTMEDISIVDAICPGVELLTAKITLKAAFVPRP
jgi:hypothetical protein